MIPYKMYILSLYKMQIPGTIFKFLRDVWRYLHWPWCFVLGRRCRPEWAAASSTRHRWHEPQKGEWVYGQRLGDVDDVDVVVVVVDDDDDDDECSLYDSLNIINVIYTSVCLFVARVKPELTRF